MKMEGKRKGSKKGGGIINQGEFSLSLSPLYFTYSPTLYELALPALLLLALALAVSVGTDGKGETVNGLCGLLPAGRVR